MSYQEQINQGVPFGKRSLHGKERQTVLQVVVGVTIFMGFVAAPVLGKKLAYRDSDVLNWIPWGDYTVNKHYKGVTEYHTKEDIHRSLVEYQKIMHERAIRGEFVEQDQEQSNTNNMKKKPLPYEDDLDKRNSIYWRPNLSDGPALPDDDDDDDGDE